MLECSQEIARRLDRIKWYESIILFILVIYISLSVPMQNLYYIQFNGVYIIIIIVKEWLFLSFFLLVFVVVSFGLIQLALWTRNHSKTSILLCVLCTLYRQDGRHIYSAKIYNRNCVGPSNTALIRFSNYIINQNLFSVQVLYWIIKWILYGISII